MPDCLKKGKLTADILAVYSSDTTKLLQISDQEVLNVSEIPAFIAKLEHRHHEGPSPLGRAMAKSGLIRLQGALWVARACLVTGERFRERLQEYVGSSNITK